MLVHPGLVSECCIVNNIVTSYLDNLNFGVSSHSLLMNCMNQITRDGATGHACLHCRRGLRIQFQVSDSCVAHVILEPMQDQSESSFVAFG